MKITPKKQIKELRKKIDAVGLQKAGSRELPILFLMLELLNILESMLE